MNISLLDKQGRPLLEFNNKGVSTQDIIQQCAYRGLVLDNIQLEDLVFRDFNLQGLIARGARFVNCTFVKVSFRGGNLQKSQFIGCKIDYVDVKDCNVSDIEYSNTSIGKVYPPIGSAAA